MITNIYSNILFYRYNLNFSQILAMMSYNNHFNDDDKQKAYNLYIKVYSLKKSVYYT